MRKTGKWCFLGFTESVIFLSKSFYTHQGYKTSSSPSCRRVVFLQHSGSILLTVSFCDSFLISALCTLVQDWTWIFSTSPGFWSQAAQVIWAHPWSTLIMTGVGSKAYHFWIPPLDGRPYKLAVGLPSGDIKLMKPAVCLKMVALAIVKHCSLHAKTHFQRCQSCLFSCFSWCRLHLSAILAVCEVRFLKATSPGTAVFAHV